MLRLATLLTEKSVDRALLFAAFAGLTITLSSWRSQLETERANNWETVSVSRARSFFNDRLVANYVGAHEGGEDLENPWAKEIRASLQFMFDKLKSEQLILSFVKGECGMDVAQSAPPTAMLTILYDMWRIHHATAMDTRTTSELLEGWYGGPKTCRLGRFSTTVALMNVAERQAVGDEAAAEAVSECYNSVTEKLGRNGVCAGSVMNPEEFQQAKSLFRATFLGWAVDAPSFESTYKDSKRRQHSPTADILRPDGTREADEGGLLPSGGD